MLEKPLLSDDLVHACLRSDYGLTAAQVEFLPLGADENTAVYRVTAGKGTYFLKLRRGAFDPLPADLTHYLRGQGVQQVLAPLETRSDQSWTRLPGYTATLFPFITGRSGFEVVLSAEQWSTFGLALKRIHNLPLPLELQQRLPRETYSPYWREKMLALLASLDEIDSPNSLSAETALFLIARRADIESLVQRAARHAHMLTAQPHENVLCHADIHAGNLLIAEDGSLYIADWDDALLALKERDLMYIGGAQGFLGCDARTEEDLFYQGYCRDSSEVDINLSALAYYRCERIVQDIVLFSQQLLQDDGAGLDRERAFHYLTANFDPGGTLDTALQTDRAAGYRITK